MSLEPLYKPQLDFLCRIASFRTIELDSVFLFLNYFDSQYFLMVLIPFVWVGISPRWGIRLALLLILNTLINFHLKMLFQLPRPIVNFPQLAMLPFSTPGFPSGAAQTAMLLGSLIVHAWKNGWAYLIAVPYVLIISFSRLYLGVHYPIDILGGWAFGMAIFFAYICAIGPIEKYFSGKRSVYGFLLCAALCFLYSVFLANPEGLILMGAFIGFIIGYLALSSPYSTNHKPIWKQIVIGVAAVLSVFIGYKLLLYSSMPLPVQSFLIALWISIMPTFFTKRAGSKRDLFHN